MTKLRELLKGRTLWFGFLAAFLPLLLFLALQYWWLTKLEGTSALAGRAVLGNFLEAVTTDIVYAYGPSAERALDLPPSIFSENHLERAAANFRKRSVEGVKALFVVRFSLDEWGTLLFYDPVSETMSSPPPSAQARAVTVACAPWKLMNDKGIEVDETRLVVEERDPDNRIILSPIVNGRSRVVGVAGMILDADHFRRRLVPSIIEASLPKFFSGRPSGEVIVTVRDARGNIVFATDPASAAPDDISRHFSFVFTDWRLGIRSRGLSPEQWARAGFIFNISVSVLAAVLLTGGLTLALRTASREMKLSRMKSDFVANVSHELRTPVASIRIFGELLRMGKASTPEKVREYGEYIETESSRLTQLINNILDFTRIEAGQKTYHFATGDASELVAETVRTFQARLTQSGFEIAFEHPDSPLPAIRFDQDALAQALHNLLDNAVKYSGGSRWIGVKLDREDAGIAICVKDRGIGISRDEQKRVFERFHRVGTGLVHDVKGSGLGLSIVHHIVAAHAGHVTVQSEPDRGSVFSIHIPGAPSPLPGALARRGEGPSADGAMSDPEDAE